MRRPVTVGSTRVEHCERKKIRWMDGREGGWGVKVSSRSIRLGTLFREHSARMKSVGSEENRRAKTGLHSGLRVGVRDGRWSDRLDD